VEPQDHIFRAHMGHRIQLVMQELWIYSSINYTSMAQM
jgi:hypothetical protein